MGCELCQVPAVRAYRNGYLCGDGRSIYRSQAGTGKRCGTVSKVDEETYRFSADVLDAYEMMPWIRTFFGRIKAIRCDNEDVKNQIKIDMVKMLKQYEDENAFS